MKANEAPEKIYLYPYPTDGIYEVETKPLEGTIEYIRTDAFIEKAKEWFEKRNEWRDINGIKHCDMEDFEDFKNYMEGK